MNLERYSQSIRHTYGSLEHQYVLQDAERSLPFRKEKDPLFADRLIAAFQKKTAEGKNNSIGEQFKRRIETYKVLDGLRQFAKEWVLLIGKPGSGKTTALQKLLLDETQREEQLTVLVELRRFKASVLDITYAFVESHQLGLSLEDLKQKLEKGHCLLLIDGLNELPSEAAQTDLQNFLKLYYNCPIVATTRDIELGGDFGIQKKLELQVLTPSQVETFVRAYIIDETRSDKLLQQLQLRLKDFQETPLLLSMLCAVFQRYESIPDNLSIVFRDFAQLYDSAFKQGVEKISYCRDLLSYLAFKMMCGKDRLNPILEVSEEEVIRWLSELTQVEDSYNWAKDWLIFLRKYHLLQKRSDSRIEFKHQLWQEYYAAEYLLHYLPQLNNEQIKHNFINLLKWTEVLKLVQSLTDNEAQALRIALLGLETDFLLGASLSGAVRDSFIHQCISQLKSYPLPIQWRYVGLQPWLLPMARQIMKMKLYREVGFHRTASQVMPFLDSVYPQIRRSTVVELGTTGNNRFLPALTRALEDKDFLVRGNAAKALGRIGDSSCIPFLTAALEDKSYIVGGCAADALGLIKDNSSVIALTAALKGKNNWVRACAAKSLGYIGDRTVLSTIVELLNDEKLQVRGCAAIALGEIGDSSSVPVLITAVKDKDSWVRSSALTALGKIGDSSSVRALIAVIKHKDSFLIGNNTQKLNEETDGVFEEGSFWKGSKMVCTSNQEIDISPIVDLVNDTLKQGEKSIAIRRREKMKNDLPASLITATLNHRDFWGRHIALASILSISRSSSITVLIKALKDKNVIVRVHAIEALGRIGDRSYVPVLAEALGNKNIAVRVYAIEALGRIGDHSCVPVLIGALGDKNTMIRSNAIEALGRIGDRSCVPVLIEALGDKNTMIRSNAIEALGRIGDRSCVPALMEALKDKSSWVRTTAAKVLGNVGSADAIQALWHLQFQPRHLYEEDDYVEQVKLIQNRCQFYNNFLYKKGEIPLPPTRTSRIPAIDPVRIKANFSGNIGAININSSVTGSATGVQVNQTNQTEIN